MVKAGPGSPLPLSYQISASHAQGLMGFLIELPYSCEVSWMDLVSSSFFLSKSTQGSSLDGWAFIHLMNNFNDLPGVYSKGPRKIFLIWFWVRILSASQILSMGAPNPVWIPNSFYKCTPSYWSPPLIILLWIDPLTDPLKDHRHKTSTIHCLYTSLRNKEL